MTRILTFMRTFPHYHPRRGEPTFFVEKIWQSIGLPDKEFSFNLPDQYVSFMRAGSDEVWSKHHTIRAGNRFKPGDFVRPCVWQLPGGRFAKGNKLIQFAPDIEVVKTWEFIKERILFIDHLQISNAESDFINEKDIAKNDGLKFDDYISWFEPYIRNGKTFSGQIICWNYEVEY